LLKGELIMEFKHEKGRIYAEDENGKVIAEVTFPASDGTSVIDHTFVDDSLRGQGIAGKLVKAAVEQIKNDGNNVSATCPYASKWLDKHPEIERVDTKFISSHS
jgi:predicted GNAT family acetyltransferase